MKSTLLAGILSSAFFAFTAASAAHADDSLPGAYTVSQRTVTVTRSNGTTFTAQIRYPAASTAANAPFATAAAPAPAVSFGHGFLSAVDLYDSTMDHLASHGYIVIATTSESSLLPSHANFALDIRQCLTWLEQQDVLAGGWLLGAVDETKLAVSGHSMGGGASALAAAADTRIKCVATLAAAETNPSAANAALSIQVPARYIVGSQDTIVAPGTTQNQYTNTDAPRQFATITGGSHCGFIDSAIIACDSGSLARADQLAKTRALLLEFFNTHLRGDSARFAAVWGGGATVAGTTLTRDARTTATLGAGALSGRAGTPLETTLTVVNAGPDATAIAPRVANAVSPIAVTFTPSTSAVLAAGQSAVFTVRATSSAAASATATIDAVRVRDGAGASANLGITFSAASNPADLDGNGTVDAADLATLLNSWGKCAGCAADLDGNGTVDAADLAILLNAWS